MKILSFRAFICRKWQTVKITQTMQCFQTSKKGNENYKTFWYAFHQSFTLFLDDFIPGLVKEFKLMSLGWKLVVILFIRALSVQGHCYNRNKQVLVQDNGVCGFRHVSFAKIYLRNSSLAEAPSHC